MDKWSVRDLIPMKVAFEQSLNSSCLKKHVGAVIVSNNEMIAETFNRFPFPSSDCTPDSPCFIKTEQRFSDLLEDYKTKKPLAPELRAILNVHKSGFTTIGAKLLLRDEITVKSSSEIIAAGIESVLIYMHIPKRDRDVHIKETKILLNNGVHVDHDYINDYWFDVKLWEGDTSTGETKLSAILLDGNGEVIGKAKKYHNFALNNGYFRNIGSCENVCAERMAIYDCLKKNSKAVEGATMYITHEPCYFCALMIVQVGIKRVIFSYPSKEKHFGIYYLKNNNIVVKQFNHTNFISEIDNEISNKTIDEIPVIF